MGLLDFKADDGLARLEADFNDQPPNIPIMPNRRRSLQCPSPNIPIISNRKISLQCRTTGYPCSAQPQNIYGMPNSRISIFLQRICSAARKTIEGGVRETLFFLGNNDFRLEMLEIKYFSYAEKPNRRMRNLGRRSKFSEYIDIICILKILGILLISYAILYIFRYPILRYIFSQMNIFRA